MGASSNAAQQQAQAAEDQRNASIKQTQGAVNDVFNSPQRAKDIASFVNSTRDYYTQDLDQQKGLNDRQLKFALARGGLTGGSEQVDKQAQLGRDYTKGLLTVDQKANAAGANLESQDQASRAQLIALATSGLDTTTGIQQAEASQRSALAAAQGGAGTQALGDLFGDFSSFYQNVQNQQAQRKANQSLVSLYGNNQPGQPNYSTGGGY